MKLSERKLPKAQKSPETSIYFGGMKLKIGPSAVSGTNPTISSRETLERLKRAVRDNAFKAA